MRGRRLMDAIWMKETLSQRVATCRHCLILLKNRSTKLRARERHGLKQIGSLRFRRQLLSLVCYRRQPGKYVLNLKFTAFAPTRTWAMHCIVNS